MSETVRRLKTYSTYLKERFGEPVLKIPINAGFSCPNRDGTKGTGGCAFCDNGAFSPVAQDTSDVVSQLERGIRYSGKRFSKYIAYLQPYTNTHGSLSRLKIACESLLRVPGVVGIAVGTRPDCIPSRTADYFEELSHRTYLSVELGMQTIHDETLAVVNRCMTWSEAAAGIATLGQRKIEIVAHLMLGLADEDRAKIMATARKVSTLPIHGVKLHQLMIIRGTTLERDYQNGYAQVLSLEQYAALVAEFLHILRPDQIIHRLMADCSIEHGLVAPLWSAEKARSLDFIRKILQKNQIH